MQVLYHYDVNPHVDPDWVHGYVAEELHFPALEAFTHHLINGVLARRGELDRLIAESAQNWRLERMSAVDRNVLRVALFEMRFLGRDAGATNSSDEAVVEPTPPKVAIDEAVEISRRFSGSESASFVNGILDRLLRGSQGSEPPTEAGASDADAKPAEESTTNEPAPEGLPPN
jgi:N utilization substance protein B